jgi:cell division septation protein DedD
VPPATLPPPTSAGPKYYVLIGAFSKPENVETIRKKFAADSAIDTSPLDAMGRTLTRVRVGPVDSMEKAKALLAKAHRYAMPDARIISEK